MTIRFLGIDFAAYGPSASMPDYPDSHEHPGIVISLPGRGSLRERLKTGANLGVFRSVRRALVEKDFGVGAFSGTEGPDVLHLVYYTTLEEADQVREQIGARYECYLSMISGAHLGERTSSQWEYISYRLEWRMGEIQRLDIDLRKPANIMLMTDEDFQAYTCGGQFFFGGGACWPMNRAMRFMGARSHVAPGIEGVWQVVIDLDPERTGRKPFPGSRNESRARRGLALATSLEEVRPRFHRIPYPALPTASSSGGTGACPDCCGSGTYALGSEALGSRGNYNTFRRGCLACGGSG